MDVDLAQTLEQSYLTQQNNENPWATFAISDVGTITQSSDSYNVFGSSEFEQDVFTWFADKNGFQLIDSQGSSTSWLGITQWNEAYNSNSAWVELKPKPNVRVDLVIWLGDLSNRSSMTIRLDGSQGHYVVLDPDGVRRRQQQTLESTGTLVGSFQVLEENESFKHSETSYGSSPPNQSYLAALRLQRWTEIVVNNPEDPEEPEDPEWVTPQDDPEWAAAMSSGDLINDWLAANNVSDKPFAFYGIVIVAGLIIVILRIWRVNRG
jgi:hypothetical protein